MTDTRALLSRTAELAADFLDSLGERPVFPQVSLDELRSGLHLPLQAEPLDPAAVVEQLAEAADPGLVAMPSGRYFGFVIGGGATYAQALSVADRVYATEIDAEIHGDTYFPELAGWRRVHASEPAVENGHAFSFVTYERA